MTQPTQRIEDPMAGAAAGVALHPKVLLAEDDATFRTLIGSMLTEVGYHVVEAIDGGELLERLSDSIVAPPNEPPLALVITDLRMPGLSGLDALQFLRTGPWRDLPVILITAFADDQTQAAARALGAEAVFDKPFEVAALRAKVQALVPGAAPSASPQSSSSSGSREPPA